MSSSPHPTPWLDMQPGTGASLKPPPDPNLRPTEQTAPSSPLNPHAETYVPPTHLPESAFLPQDDNAIDDPSPLPSSVDSAAYLAYFPTSLQQLMHSLYFNKFGYTLMIDRNLLTPQSIAHMSTLRPYNELLHKFTEEQIVHPSFVSTIMKLYAIGTHFRHIGFNSIYHQGIDVKIVSDVDFLAYHSDINQVHDFMSLHDTNGYSNTLANAIRLHLSQKHGTPPKILPIFHPVPIFLSPPPIDQRTIIQDPHSHASPLLVLPRPPYPWLDEHERVFTYHVPGNLRLQLANGDFINISDGVSQYSSSPQQSDVIQESIQNDSTMPQTSPPKVETVTSHISGNNGDRSHTSSSGSLFSPRQIGKELGTKNDNTGISKFSTIDKDDVVDTQLLHDTDVTNHNLHDYDDVCDNSQSTPRLHNYSTTSDLDTDTDLDMHRKLKRRIKYKNGMRVSDNKYKKKKKKKMKKTSRERHKERLYDTFSKEGLRAVAQYGESFHEEEYDKSLSSHPTWPVSPLDQRDYNNNVRRIMNTKAFKKGEVNDNFPKDFQQDVHADMSYLQSLRGKHEHPTVTLSNSPQQHVSPLHSTEVPDFQRSSYPPPDPDDSNDSSDQSSTSSSSSSDTDDPNTNNNGDQSIVNSAVTVMTELVQQVKHLRDGTTDKTKVKQRPTLPTRIYWDGKIDTFHRFSSSFEGHYSQSGARYLFDKNFQDAYLEYGTSAIDHLAQPIPDLTKAQVQSDVTSIYGALWTSCIAHEVGYSQILKYSGTSDGIRAWIDLKTTYDNKDIRTIQLDVILNTPWTSKSRMHLSDWLTSFDSAFNELEHVFHDMRYGTDAAKRRQLLLQLRDNTDLEWLDYTEKFDTYHELRNGLYKLAVKREDTYKNRARMRMAHSHVTSDQLGASLAHLLDNTHDISDLSLARLTRVEDDLWKRLPSDVRRAIQDAQRNEMQRRYKSQGGPRLGNQYNRSLSNTKDTQPDVVTDQNDESKANAQHLISSINASTIEEQAAIDEYLSNYIDTESEDDIDYNSISIRMAITSIRSISLSNTSLAFIAASSSTLHHSIAIIDSGADTCILGKGWFIQYTHPTRKVNVIGFDENLPGRHKLSVVTGISAIDLPNNEVLLIRVHEGIHNPDSENTLLSTIQLRDHCLEVNDIPRIQGGKQCIQPDDNHTIPLQLHNAMITFRFRVPTDDEIAFGNIIDITSPRPWQPSKYTDIELDNEHLFDDHESPNTRDDDINAHDIPPIIVNNTTSTEELTCMDFRGDNASGIDTNIDTSNDIPPSSVICNTTYLPPCHQHDELPSLSVRYGEISTLANDISLEQNNESQLHGTSATSSSDIQSEPSISFSNVSTVSRSDESNWNQFQALAHLSNQPSFDSSPLSKQIILWRLPSEAKTIHLQHGIINPITGMQHVHVFWSRTHSLSDITIHPFKSAPRVIPDDSSLNSTNSSDTDDKDTDNFTPRHPPDTSNTTALPTTPHNTSSSVPPSGSAQCTSPQDTYANLQPLRWFVPGNYVYFSFNHATSCIHFVITDFFSDETVTTTPSSFELVPCYFSPSFNDSNCHINMVMNDAIIDPDDPRSTPFHPDEQFYDIPRLHRATPNKIDFYKLSPYFLYRPQRIIRETLRQSTQLATMIIRQPLRRHFKPRYPFVQNRINEARSTDTYYMPIRSLEGYTCAQVFVGMTSHQKFVHGMRTESEFPSVYKDHLRTHGIPHTLRRDNAKAQDSKEVAKIHRDLLIKDEYSEPYNQQQNPAENLGVKSLKQRGTIIMDRTNTPANLWFLCHQYICYVDNKLAHPLLNYRIPNQVAGGDRPDISEILCFYWMQPVLSLDIEAKDPDTREEPGYFVGFEENIGDALTFKILMTDM